MRAMNLIVLGLIGVFAPTTFAAPDRSIPLTLYTQLASTAQSAKGAVHFTLAQGVTTTRIPGTPDIQWIVRPGISATAEFDYVDGHWKSLRLSFSDWIEASFREGTVEAHRQKLTAIAFDNGVPNDYYDEEAQPVGRSLSEFPEVRAHLRILNGPASILLGTLFAGLSQSPSLPNQGLSPTSITIEPGEREPGAALVLKSQSLLSLSQDSPGDIAAGSWIRLGAPTAVSITSLRFDLTESVIGFHVASFSATLSDARLGLGDTVLVPAGGQITFNSVDADSTKPDEALNITAGAFAGKLGAGSVVQLTRNSLGATSFVPQPSIDASIGGFSLSIRGDGVGTLTAHSVTIPVGSESAVVVFDHTDMLKLSINPTQNPVLSIDKAIWAGGELPVAVGRLSSFTAAITGGVLALERSHLNVLQGTVAANGLSIGVPNSNTVTGSLQQLSFVVDADSVVDAGAGAVFRLSSGVVSAAGSDPTLVFDSAQDGVIGTLNVADAVVDNGILPLGSQALLAVSADHANFTAVRVPLKTQWSVSGKVAVSTGSFVFNTVGSFLIQSGTIDVSNLTMNGSGILGGSVSALDLAIAPQTIQFGDDFSVVALGTCRLQMGLGKSLTVSDKGNLVGDLSLAVPILTGTIHFGQVGVFNLKGGNVNIVADAATDLSAQIKIDLDVQVASGDMKIPPSGEIQLGDGTITASGMAGSPSLGLVGPVARADLAIESATFSFKNGMQFNTTSGRFVSTTNFTISSDGLSVSGPFSLRTSLDKLTTGPNAGLSVSGGDLDLELDVQDDRALVTQAGPASYLRGAKVHFQSPKGDMVDLILNLENVRLTAPADQAATLVSDLRGTFTQFALKIQTTPQNGYSGDHDNARFFSLSMNVAIDSSQESLVSIDSFLLTAGQPVPAIKPTVHLLLTLPPGDGEHPNSSINEPGNHGGPERMQNAQEAFTDTYPACRIHIYFFPGTYHVTADLDLSQVWSGGKVRVTDISLSPGITRNTNTTTLGWDRDGCDGFLYEAIIVGFSGMIGDAIAGPAGGLVLGDLGLKLINFGEDRLDNWINAWLASRIQSLQFSPQT